MSEQNNQYRDSALNLDQAYYYTLLLLIDSTTFSYAISYRNKVLGFGEGYDVSELKSPAALRDVLNSPFKKVVIGYVSNGFTLIPHHVINQEHAVDFARLLDVKPDEKVLGRVLDDQNYVLCKVDGQLLESADKFSFKDIVFAGEGLVKLIAQNSPKDDMVYLNITGNKADYLNFKADSLNFYNRFEFNSADDLLYFTASIINELGLPAPTVQICLSGNVSATGKTYELLSQYFPNVSINRTQLLEVPSELGSHKLLAIMALSLCASLEAA